MKVSIFLQSRRFFKYFYDSGCFVDLDKNHDITYLILKTDLESIKTLKKDGRKFKTVSYIPSKKIYRLFEIYSNLSLKRHASRSNSFSLKFGNFYKSWSKKGRLFFQVMSLPIIFETFSLLFKKVFVGNPLLVEEGFSGTSDCIIVPSGGTMDVYSMLAFKASKSLSIESVMLMFNWDNITCKGVYPFPPSYALLWGDQSKRHYIKINKVKKQNVLVVGSAQFAPYEEPEEFNIKKLNLRTTFGLPEEKILGTYLGGARYRSDITLFKKLEPILKSNDMALVYRPHPWQDSDMLQEDFFKEGFTSIFMDPSMELHYKSSRNDPNYNIKEFIPELDYFPSFLSEIDFAISSYSTMSLESIKMGKPVLLTGFKDPKFPYSFDKLRTYEHHDEWKNIKYVIECLDEAELPVAIQKIKDWLRDPVVSKELVDSSKSICYFDEKNYSQRLAEITEEVFNLKDFKI